MVSALDRTNTSDRKAALIVSATAQALGHDVSELAISPSAIREARIRNRTNAAAAVKQQVTFSSSTTPLVVQWDGKLLLTPTGGDRVNRLAILVSGKDTPTPAEASQLLGVPTVARGTGESQTAAVSAVLSEWKLDNRAVGLNFDMKVANTGRLNEACTD